MCKISEIFELPIIWLHCQLQIVFLYITNQPTDSLHSIFNGKLKKTINSRKPLLSSIDHRSLTKNSAKYQGIFRSWKNKRSCNGTFHSHYRKNKWLVFNNLASVNSFNPFSSSLIPPLSFSLSYTLSFAFAVEHRALVVSFFRGFAKKRSSLENRGTFIPATCPISSAEARFKCSLAIVCGNFQPLLPPQTTIFI